MTRIIITAALAATAAMTCGCANLWDDVTSRDFHVRSLFTRDDPMTVLSLSTDGDQRAKALRALKEPKVNGGSEAEQEQVLQILARAAVAEPQPVVRIAAIETLGTFHDARAVQGLTGAYEAANQLAGDAAVNVRCLALTALGNTKQPDAIQFLARVAQAPPPPADANDRDRQHARDCRLAAVRALGNFEGSRQVEDVMSRLLQAERDVAVRDRAKETYAAVTGSKPAFDMAAPGTTEAAATEPFQLTGGSAPRP